jgi:AraC-like DNA-binding protein
VRRHLACRPRRKRQLSEVASPGVTGDASIAGTGRVLERRRAVALARHYREAEGLSIAQIADRLGRSSATVKAYFYDPTGEKARALKALYPGACRRCGAATQRCSGKGSAVAEFRGLAAVDVPARFRRRRPSSGRAEGGSPTPVWSPSRSNLAARFRGEGRGAPSASWGWRGACARRGRSAPVGPRRALRLELLIGADYVHYRVDQC